MVPARRPRGRSTPPAIIALLGAIEDGLPRLSPTTMKYLVMYMYSRVMVGWQIPVSCAAIWQPASGSASHPS